MPDEERAGLARPARTRQELREAAERARAAAGVGGGNGGGNGGAEDQVRRLLDAAEHLPAADPEIGR